MPCMELIEQRAIIVVGQRKAGEMAGGRRQQIQREARVDFLVVLIDQPVLVAQREGIGNAHAYWLGRRGSPRREAAE